MELIELNMTHYRTTVPDLISILGQGYHIKRATVGKQTNKKKHPPKYELIIFPSYCRCGLGSDKWSLQA